MGGAKNVICTWRSRPLGFAWPKEIQERPLLQRLEGKTAHFKDGTSAEVDVIMMCTGYLHKYDFLREDLRLKSKNVFYPPNLYKGIVWQEGGNNKLLLRGAGPVLHLHHVRCLRSLGCQVHRGRTRSPQQGRHGDQ